MKTAVLVGKADIRLEERPIPAIGAGEMLLKLRACGLCGTDVHKALHLTVKPPTVLGHEVCGEVVEVGPGVTKFRTGDRVALPHHTPCFGCHYCRRGHHTLCKTWKQSNIDPGGFAEYIRIPAPQVQHNAFLVPDSLSDVAASFLEPLACIVRGFNRATPNPGDTVLVLGAGPIGILHLQVACHHLAGKTIVADISDYRLSQAQRFGADHVINNGKTNLVEAVRSLTGGRGVDMVIIAASVPSLLTQAIELLDLGGTVMVFAPLESAELQIDARRFFDSEISIIGSFSSGPNDLQKAFSLLTSRTIRVDEMVTHRMGLGEVGAAISLVRDPNAEVMKVAIVPEATHA